MVQNINMPVTNPELIAAIEAIKKEANDDTQDSFYKALKNARFLSPVTIEPRPEPGDAGGKATLTVDTKISFADITDVNGDIYMPVYTDWSALKQWRDVPDEQTLITSYEDISGMVLGNPKIAGFVINPFSHNMPIHQSAIDQINAGSVNQWTADKDTTLHIGIPANDPVAMKKAVVKHLKSQKNVSAAWLVLMENGGEFSFLMVVDFVGDRNVVFSGIASIAVPKLRNGELIDMVPADSDLGRQVAHDYPPFYKRKALGLF